MSNGYGSERTTRVSKNGGRIANYAAQGVFSTSVISRHGRFIAFQARASDFVLGASSDVANIFIFDRLKKKYRRINANTFFIPDFSISANGRYVAFASDQPDLDASDTNNVRDVFLFDSVTGQISRISVSSIGKQGNKASFNPHLSADGRYITFSSEADNLVEADTNGNIDVFVYDQLTRQTSRVSVKSGGAQSEGGGLYSKISGDGRFVVFQSRSDDLVANDFNEAADVFVHDRSRQHTERVSVNSLGSETARFRDNRFADISENGRYVVFESLDYNFSEIPLNFSSGVFVRDRASKQTTLVSVGLNGVAPNGSFCTGVDISANGRYVTFESDATNLDSRDVINDFDIYAHDRWNKKTSLVNLNSNPDYRAGGASLSADGRQIAFESDAPDLVVGDDNNLVDVFVRGNPLARSFPDWH